MRLIRVIRTLALALTAAQATPAPAMEIVTRFIGGSPPVNAAGEGNLADIFNAAARIWESAYADSFTLVLHFGWAPLGDAGTHTLVEQGGTPSRELVGTILFDNSGAIPLFLDPTPGTNEEYRRLTEEQQELGGGLTNVARIFSHPIAEAAGRADLLTIALHEIGHALGMCNGNLRFIEQSRPGAVIIAGNLPFTGTVVPLASNRLGFTSHIDPNQVAYGSVMAGLCADERRIPSALDILTNAQISSLEVMNLNLLQLQVRDSAWVAPGGRRFPSSPEGQR
jgi:hypothetical protein